jgi:hypothetical protein
MHDPFATYQAQTACVEGATYEEQAAACEAEYEAEQLILCALQIAEQPQEPSNMVYDYNYWVEQGNISAAKQQQEWKCRPKIDQQKNQQIIQRQIEQEDLRKKRLQLEKDQQEWRRRERKEREDEQRRRSQHFVRAGGFCVSYPDIQYIDMFRDNIELRMDRVNSNNICINTAWDMMPLILKEKHRLFRSNFADFVEDVVGHRVIQYNDELFVCRGMRRTSAATFLMEKMRRK